MVRPALTRILALSKVHDMGFETEIRLGARVDEAGLGGREMDLVAFGDGGEDEGRVLLRVRVVDGFDEERWVEGEEACEEASGVEPGEGFGGWGAREEFEEEADEWDEEGSCGEEVRFRREAMVGFDSIWEMK